MNELAYQQGSNEPLRELALFAGAGGGILGGKLLGWETVCAVEWEAYPASVLMQRQNDGILAPFPIWDDVRTFDGKPWRGIVDVVSGGFPCQDISAAGKGAGIAGSRSGLWKEMGRIISEVRPRFVFVENSPMLTSRGLGTVLGDLAAMGFDAEWGVLSAADVGAPHLRERVWILANSIGVNSDAWRAKSARQQWQARLADGSNDMADAMRNRSQGQRQDGRTQGQARLCSGARSDKEQGLYDTSGRRYRIPKGKVCTRWNGIKHADWWATEPAVGRVVDGMVARVDRLKAIGNGQVPLCAATAFNLLRERLKA